MKVFNLPKPKAPFEKINVIGESITLATAGKVLVLPSGNSAVLPSFNEYVLTSNRLTIAESPFGGLKGAGSPDYSVGTLFCQTDGVYITDVNGNNSTKTLTAGKQKELGTLSVDTVNHTVTQEFIIANTATSNSPTVIDACDYTTGWGTGGTGASISTSSGTLRLSTTSANNVYAQKPGSYNFSSYHFVCITLTGPAGKTGRFYLANSGYSASCYWTLNYNGSQQVYVLPIKKPTASTGTLDLSSIAFLRIDILSAGVGDVLVFDNITADIAKAAYFELQTPNDLADTSMVSQKYTGSTYETSRVLKLDSTASVVSADTTKMVFGDQTKFDDVYGTGNGRSNFPKGSAGETKSGTLAGSQITYSENEGTDKRVGFRVDLPPSDGGGTAFNSVRFKIITYYSDVNKATNILPDLSGNGNNGTMSCVGLTADGAGNAYGAMSFDGVRSYVQKSSPVNIPIGANPRTLVTWINPNVLNVTQAFFGYGTGIDLQRCMLGISNTGKLSMYGHTTGDVISDISITNDWQRVVLTYDGTSLKLYKNGGSPYSVNKSLNTVHSAGGIVLGSSPVLSLFYTGKIKDARVYSRAWSQAEVTADYAGQPVSSTGLVASWSPSAVSNMGSTSYNFENSSNTSYGLQNITKPYILIFDPVTNTIDFYLFTHRPKNLILKRNESGVIYELQLFPGNGVIYHGQITHPNLTLDSNSNLIPDCLEASINGSVTKFLENYGMVID